MSIRVNPNIVSADSVPPIRLQELKREGNLPCGGWGTTSVKRFVPVSGGLDLVPSFAFFVEVDQYQKSNIKNQNDRSKRKKSDKPKCQNPNDN
jgi:hypothetical protein